MLKRILLPVLIAVCCLLSSCYSQSDLVAEYKDGYYAGYELGLEESYDYGYEVGHSDGFIEGYEDGYADGWDSFLIDDFQDYWEDWLFQAYDITEPELCVLLGLPTDSPSPSPSPAPTATPTPTPAPTFAVLTVSSRGDSVSKVQSRLNDLGFDAGVVDGIYGNQTAAAVSAFQRVAGLPISGKVSYQTMTALFKATAPTVPPATATPRPTVRVTATPRPTARPTATPAPQVKYIGNRNSYKFHYTWCSSVDQMKESNKVFFYYRSDATSRGYVPCKRCDP